jgi:predicted Holliday junction resolvase-like endonuclease
MTNNQLIQDLQNIPDLYGICPRCMSSFKISDAFLFDSLTKKFPDIATVICKQYQDDLKQRVEKLEKRKISVKDAEQKAINVGLGTIVEDVLPAYQQFPFNICDCRGLFEPIDTIVFNGLSQNNVDRIVFLETKYGGSQLKTHQRKIRDAVREKRVEFKVI